MELLAGDCLKAEITEHVGYHVIPTLLQRMFLGTTLAARAQQAIQNHDAGMLNEDIEP